MRINGEMPSNEFQRYLFENKTEDIDISLFDSNNNGVIENEEYNNFINSTQPSNIDEYNFDWDSYEDISIDSLIILEILFIKAIFIAWD